MFLKTEMNPSSRMPDDLNVALPGRRMVKVATPRPEELRLAESVMVAPEEVVLFV